jgi:transposase-like protein|tara:strand:- start:334 stop:1167 length:834 start_codon:yes stop_codon:yes gene_type:complete
MQETLEEALESELDEFLGYPKHQRSTNRNYRNGHTEKAIRTDSGEMDLKVPRDRDSDFEPQLVKKRQTVLEDLEEKIIALYSKGMTTRDIQDLLGEMYGVDLSPSLISRLTDRIIPRLEEWQSRPLKEVYPVIWPGCLFYRVRHESKVINKAIYVIIGVGTDGHKGILGLWISLKESSSFWLGVLNDLKSRGVKDVLIFSVDGLAGIAEAIQAAYPQADVQQCVIHQIRNTLRYVAWKDKKELARELKKVYGASTIDGPMQLWTPLKTAGVQSILMP